MANAEKVVNIARVIDRSALRMTRLIEDVLDFARGRLGGGIAVNRAPDPGLQAMLDQVVDEMQTGNPIVSSTPRSRLRRMSSASAPASVNSLRSTRLVHTI